jgi:hypothetical protein
MVWSGNPTFFSAALESREALAIPLIPLLTLMIFTGRKLYKNDALATKQVNISPIITVQP